MPPPSLESWSCPMTSVSALELAVARVFTPDRLRTSVPLRRIWTAPAVGSILTNGSTYCHSPVTRAALLMPRTVPLDDPRRAETTSEGSSLKLNCGAPARLSQRLSRCPPAEEPRYIAWPTYQNC